MQGSKRRFVKKAGHQVPARIASLMASRHPTVDILWCPQEDRWALVQRIRGHSFLIRVLGTKERFEAPTLMNTVYYLDSIHPSRFQSEFAKERLLAELDRNEQAETAQKRAQNQIHEGSKDLFNVMTNRRVLRIAR